MARGRMGQDMAQPVDSSADSTRDVWYRAIHDILPTREWLSVINLAPTALCPECAVPDTLLHRVTRCGDGIHQWEWTRERIAQMLRLGARWIPDTWLFRPQFRMWPSQKHRALLWLLACLVD